MVILSKMDLDRLVGMVGDVPYRHAAPIMQFLTERLQRQQAEAKAAAFRAEERSAQAQAVEAAPQA